jgi:hypothetical protein
MCSRSMLEHDPESSSLDNGYPATRYRNLGGTLSRRSDEDDQALKSGKGRS